MKKENKEPKPVGIHDGHRNRMRAKFRESGFDGMAEHEALEMLLYYCIPRVNTNEQAHRLINHFGSLAGVLEASADELAKVEGISQNAAVLIAMMLPMYRMYSKSLLKAEHLSKIGDCNEILVKYFAGMTKECAAAVFISANGRVLAVEKINEGDPGMVMMDFKKVLEPAFKYPQASSVVIGHNHPTGIALPSRDDLQATAMLVKMFRTVGMELRDHVIVSGDGDYISLRESKQFSHIFTD